MEADLKSQIYNLDSQYEKCLALLEQDAAVSQENKQAIKDFVTDKLALGKTKTRAIIVVNHLRRLAHLTSKAFADFEEKDVKVLMAALETATFETLGRPHGKKESVKGQKRKPYSDNTKNVTKAILKNLLRSLGKPDAWFKWVQGKKAVQKIRAENLLTQQETLDMIQAAESLQWKALLALFFETGCRPGEVLNLRIKDVVFNGNKAKVYCNGKVGARTIYAYQSFGFLKQWANQHPLRADSGSPLWLNRRKEPLRLGTFSSYYKKLSNKAGIPAEKGNMPYLSRHSKLTVFYRDFGAVLGAKLAGHVPGSKQIGNYLHLSESDIENALDTANGLKPTEKVHEPLKCSSCGMVNGFDELACQKCREPLSSAGAVVQEAENNVLLEEARQLKAVLDIPDVQALLKLIKSPEGINALKEAVKK